MDLHETSKKKRRYAAALVALSLIWASVMIDTGEVGWPLAVWLTTAFIPITARMQQLRKDLT